MSAVTDAAKAGKLGLREALAFALGADKASDVRGGCDLLHDESFDLCERENVLGRQDSLRERINQGEKDENLCVRVN